MSLLKTIGSQIIIFLWKQWKCHETSPPTKKKNDTKNILKFILMSHSYLKARLYITDHEIFKYLVKVFPHSVSTDDSRYFKLIRRSVGLCPSRAGNCLYLEHGCCLFLCQRRLQVCNLEPEAVLLSRSNESGHTGKQTACLAARHQFKRDLSNVFIFLTRLLSNPRTDLLPQFV